MRGSTVLREYGCFLFCFAITQEPYSHLSGELGSTAKLETIKDGLNGELSYI